MMKTTQMIAMTGLATVLGLEASAQMLDPAETIAEYAEIIQTVVSPELPADRFISILPIGLSVDSDQAYYSTADSCLSPTTFPGDLAASIRVSNVYQHALENMARIKLESQPTVEEVRVAREFLDQKLAVYQQYGVSFRNLRKQLRPALSLDERNAILAEMGAIEDDWIVIGFKREVETALHTVTSSPEGYLGLRTDALADARTLGGGALASPSVVLSVGRANWADRGGWVTLKYDDSYQSSSETTEIKRRRGSGGFNAGFFKIGGSGASTTITESIESDVRQLGIEIDLKYVQIERPWFDHSVFFEPKTWGWRAIENPDVQTAPIISSGLVEGKYVEQMDEQTYGGARIDCQLYPAAFLLAKRRKLTATVSNDTYDRILRESQAGGSASFFGFSIGGGGSNKFENVTTVGEVTSFSLVSSDWSADSTVAAEPSDVIILGTVSRVVPFGPTPSDDLDYDGEVWE